jgi:hypothetical protein
VKATKEIVTGLDNIRVMSRAEGFCEAIAWVNALHPHVVNLETH